MLHGTGTGWWTYVRFDQERDRPKISWALFRRVWGYARPYQLKVLGLLVTILAITGFSFGVLLSFALSRPLSSPCGG